MKVSDLQRINQLGDQLEALYKPLRIDPHNAPLNREEEKLKLFGAHKQGEVYHPQFTYLPTPAGWEIPLRQFVEAELQPHLSDWDELLRLDALQMLEALDVTTSHDPVHITEFTLASHGEPSTELVRSAQEILENTSESVEEKTVSAEEAAKVLRSRLHQVGLTDWQVLVDEAMIAKMSVRAVEKQVRVRAGEYFAPDHVKRLLVHEIGTHVFRAVNGSHQPLRILRLGLKDYLTTEEGMATYHEERFGLKDTSDQRVYALRVLAAHMSLSQGFFDVYSVLAQYMSPDEAFATVQRAKRGFTDTSVPGSHIKDKVYLEGFIQVSQHLDKSPDDYRYLMSGKVSLDMLPILKALDADGLMVLPQFLPEMLVK